MTTGPARALLRRLGQHLDGFSACFSRAPQRAAASQYLDGLFNDSERKSMQAMHGRLSDPGQYQALQHFITHSPWAAEPVWAQLRAVVPVRAGILAIDDTGFPKQGTRSVGVQRQYCGALGKIGNCQVAVSSALIADGRTWPLACDLYLPVSWTDDAARRTSVRIPETVRFREKWRIALAQVRTILQAGFTITGRRGRCGLRHDCRLPRRASNDWACPMASPFVARPRAPSWASPAPSRPPLWRCRRPRPPGRP